MSRPDSTAANRFRGSSILRSSEMVSRKALVRSSARRRSAVEALSARGVMNVRGVSGQQHPSLAVERRLPSHIGESGDRSRTVDPVVGAVYGDERFAEIAQGGFVSSAEALFRYQNPDRALISQPAQRMDAEGVAAN